MALSASLSMPLALFPLLLYLQVWLAQHGQRGLKHLLQRSWLDLTTALASVGGKGGKDGERAASGRPRTLRSTGSIRRPESAVLTVGTTAPISAPMRWRLRPVLTGHGW